jgi:beta-glucosidase
VKRIDDAVARILSVKCELGMLDEDHYKLDAEGKLALPSLKGFATKAHRELAREAVRKSLVLLKNDRAVLPLKKTLKRVHLAGKSADDLGNQCGGWTVSWQGGSGQTTEGTTIRQAFEQVLGRAKITHAWDGSGAEAADVAVVVVGETPYAETKGDTADLNLESSDLRAVETAKQTGVPVVLVVVAGRPLILGRAFELADAVVIAWLPGSEGRGVTDVLFGNFDFVGKLPHTWPRSMDQIPINIGDEKYDPLFPYGFGLTYGPSSK